MARILGFFWNCSLAQNLSCNQIQASRAAFNIVTTGVSAPVGPSSGPVVKQKIQIMPPVVRGPLSHYV